MRIVIASNIHSGIGLERDYTLLRGYLESLGHEVEGQQFDKPPEVAACDLGIFLETISEHLLPITNRWFYFANPEWLKPEMVRPIQKHCEKVFAKTHEAERALKEKFSNVHYVGFLTEDRGRPKITRHRKCLHLGGNSGMRGTNAVIEAWRSYRYWDETVLPPLTVVSNSIETVPFEDTPGITFIKRATDEEIIELQNSHLFHVMPSATEGFGHALHEGQSCGAIILTTQAPPMSELHAAFEVAPAGKKKVNFGTLYDVAPSTLREKVSVMVSQPSHVIARLQAEARARFEKGNQEFKELFAPHLEPRITPAIAKQAIGLIRERLKPMLRIAFLGNFKPPHSTENDLLWTLRDMGHQVTTFQEDEDIPPTIYKQSRTADLFLWVHTHGWGDPIAFWDMLSELNIDGVRTVGFHLDRYWGLNQNDRREDLIGRHPWWGCKFLFTADGGNQDKFRERFSDNRHHWLRPAVVKRDCSPGLWREDLSVDVGFVGAASYHPEYPFRGQLIEFLRAVYGERFRVFNGFRGQDLNDLYASIKVVVGDSCFGGADYYWSDRVPETLGRGGFLIHPETKGLRIPGLVTFEPGNLQELQDKIDYYLKWRDERDYLRRAAHVWVRENETYHNRMKRLLEVCLG